ncbi:helix-turn-helix domain-containing protein [Paractinoplanes deccanensis]|uniref:helix-turn-helix domain-containing protein n=1 Tax=Paractinoplanes deccanensis TaxID=113561 RepID=UPI0023B30D68|nr:helix-turn-helix domain-containing protein [Actinoplanes deccanensis]
MTEICRELNVHRSIAYRLLRTLKDHQLVERDSLGRNGLGVSGLAEPSAATFSRPPRPA